MSLDPQWTDVLLALDIVPVGYITSSYVEGGTFPWQGDLLEGSTPIPFVDEIPFEAIDELDPDLILGAYSIEESDYQTLSKKAPTIPSITDAEVESWTVLAETAASIFDRGADVGSIIADVETPRSERSETSCRASRARRSPSSTTSPGPT